MEMPLHRPVPRRNFEITPASTESSHPPSPAPEQHSPEYLSDRRTDMTPQKTRSILNLTSSTLFGIYSGTSESGGLESSTPWGTGAQTPNIRKSMDGQMPEEPRLMWSERSNRPMSMSQARPKRIGLKGYYVPLAIQTVLLFAFGTGYGLIVTQLHKSQQITPVPVPGADRHASYYHISWGLFGILVGNGLPLVDSWLDESAVVDADPKPGHRRTASSSSDHDRDSLGPMWYSAVRSVGAFVGIAFAVVCRPSRTLNVCLQNVRENSRGNRRYRYHRPWRWQIRSSGT